VDGAFCCIGTILGWWEQLEDFGIFLEGFFKFLRPFIVGYVLLKEVKFDVYVCHALLIVAAW